VNNLCIIEYEQRKNSINSLVQYASIITSRARIKLYKTITQVEKEGGRLLYCDTDSIFAAYDKNKNITRSEIN
jgi:DNA polymerase elongation subunit (family B)